VEAMERRIETVGNLKDHVVYVACLSDAVVGWIDVSIGHHLQTEPFGEIGGLVVSSDSRNAGIGRRLLAQGEQWVAQQGITRMVVRSRIAREAAHRFYLREGYSRTKTSAVFSKELTETGSNFEALFGDK
jgi:GNAT superfamily N-acetyltransferase